MSLENKEYILCAANYYNDGIIHPHRPINVGVGFITCGRKINIIY